MNSFYYEYKYKVLLALRVILQRIDIPMINYALIIGGFFLLLGGAEFVVRGSIAVARRLHISTMVIGMTMVAFGTSAPELVVSLKATLDGSSSLALGNLVGSNITNTLFILGVSVMVAPIATDHPTLFRDGIALLAGTAIFMVIVLLGDIRWWGGVILLIVFSVFLKLSWRKEKGADSVVATLARETEEIGNIEIPFVLAILSVGGGLIALLYGSDFLINGGVGLARQFGVSEEVIGLTVIAFGTSLPEFAASVTAAVKKHPDLALGNVVGSNLFNILMVAGTVSIIHPISVPDQIIGFDLWVMGLATLLMIPSAITGHKLSRWEALLFLAGYLTFIAAQVTGFSTKAAQAVLF